MRAFGLWEMFYSVVSGRTDIFRAQLMEEIMTFLLCEQLECEETQNDYDTFDMWFKTMQALLLTHPSGKFNMYLPGLDVQRDYIGGRDEADKTEKP